MASTPIPGSFLLSAKLSCLFMAPDGTLQPWDVVLDVANNQTPCNATASQKKMGSQQKAQATAQAKAKAQEEERDAEANTDLTLEESLARTHR